jgi:hypothetical protein
MVGYIRSSITSECISYYKDDVIEFVILSEIIYNDTEKVEDVIVSLLSIKRDSQF